MTLATPQATGPAEITLAYHARSKHGLQRYAAGPETLDWDTQPNPFREFAGRAPLVADQLGTRFAQLYAPGGVSPTPLSVASVGALMELSMGISAWKEYGPDRWALRCNPSSGNLHPTEAYLLLSDIPGIEDGLYHYVSRDHALERRCRRLRISGTPVRTGESARLWIGLASVHWRESWKYGERAFRYCQLDIGHALGALRCAAAALGWTARVLDGIGSAELAALMGVDRAEDFLGVEAEDADLLITIDPRPPTNDSGRDNGTRALWEPEAHRWTGRANRLDPHPLYRWPIVDQVSLATRGGDTDNGSIPSIYPPFARTSGARAADIILARRSAQRFDRKFEMCADVFYRLLDCLLVRMVAPWDVWSFAPCLHPIFFIHRVEGLEPGLYALPRRPGAAQSLRQALRPDFEWQRDANAPAHLPLVKLMATDCRAIARTVSCHQAIASDGCFSLGMLSEFEPVIGPNAWRYRQLHWEAGLIGQVLYLEAEAAGLRGTGIGCYFDDPLHELLGIRTGDFQSLYHFTVGRPLTDERIATLPAYPGRRPRGFEEQG